MIISYCIPCMNRTYDLRKTLPLVIQAANASPPVEIVILDYNSQDDLEEYLLDCYPFYDDPETDNFLTHTKYTGRDTYHMAHAQNLSMLVGGGEYVVNSAADVVLTINYFSTIRELLSPGDIVWMMSTRYGIPVIRKDEFVAAGGHDERLEFYGKCDRDLHGRLHRRGGKFVKYPSDILTTIPTAKDQKHRNYSLKSAHQMKVLNKEIYEENLRNEVLTVNPDGWGSWDA